MKFFKKIGAWFKRLFTNIKKVIDNSVEPAIRFLNVIKTVVDNPLTNLAVAATKNKFDDQALAFLRKHLSTAIDILEIKLECGSKGTDQERLECYINYLRTLPVEQRKALYAKTASIIARLTAGEVDLTGSDFDLLVQMKYVEDKRA